MKMYCTLDTETVGGASNPLGFYHLGGIIHNRKGKVYGCFNYIVANMLPYVLEDDYAKKNLYLYAEMIEQGTATLVANQEDAIRAVKGICDHFNVKTMTAFNSGFDYCKTMCAELLEGREFIDLWLMALETICYKKSYQVFCAESGRYNKKGNCKTNAESVFAYLIGNPDYCEEHTALEDSKIELEIFKACIKSHKKFTPNTHWFDSPNKFALIPKLPLDK
jgi:hypothetical protein